MNTNTDRHSTDHLLAVWAGEIPGNRRAAELLVSVPYVVRSDVYADANRQHLALGGRWSDAVASAVRAYREGRLAFPECEIDGDDCPGPADGCALFPGYSGPDRHSVPFAGLA